MRLDVAIRELLRLKTVPACQSLEWTGQREIGWLCQRAPAAIIEHPCAASLRQVSVNWLMLDGT